MGMTDIPDIDRTEKDIAQRRCRTEEVLREMQILKCSNDSLVRNATVLLLTLLLFFSFGYFRVVIGF